MIRWQHVAVAALLATLAGCAPPPPPPPTVVNLTVKTTNDVNPSAANVPSPLALRVYQLTSAANFNAAEFFALYNADAATLKTDLVHRDDLLLPPGQTKTETLKPDPTVKTIAVFAAYQNFQSAVWRVSTDIEPNKTTNISLTAGPTGLTLN